MKVMVCENSPYLQALEGLRQVLQEVAVFGRTAGTQEEYDAILADQKKIDIVGLEPVYNDDSLEIKLRYMNSGRRFIRHVRKFSRLVGAKFRKLGWNLFLFPDVQGNKILIGRLAEWKPVVVAFQGPVEEGFICIDESVADYVNGFQDIEQIKIEELYPGDISAREKRDNLDEIKRLMTGTTPENIKFGFVCPWNLISHWNQNDCTIEDATDGTCIVLDHSIQTVVYVGHDRKECADWLRG